MKILVLGNSHTRALKVASAEISDENVQIDVNWLLSKSTEGHSVGELPIAEALDRARALTGDDLLALSIGGTEHSIIGLIQHPRPFDVLVPGEEHSDHEKEIIPYNTIWEIFEVRSRKRNIIEKFKVATDARVYHIATPPPMADTEVIMQRRERYRGTLLSEHGLSPAALRLKLWDIEMRALASVCNEWGVGFVPPPPEACTPDGFLARDYYADDATHANMQYGKLVIKQLEATNTAITKSGRIE